ncbi:hypothetical protein BVX98_05810 [bacterium F11]|nr:hypothetical protein BVX98_05810 [bacterium F11]
MKKSIGVSLLLMGLLVVLSAHIAKAEKELKGKILPYVPNMGVVFDSELMIQDIQPGSIFDKAKFRVGDKILKARGEPLASCKELFAVYSRSGKKRLRLTFERNERIRRKVIKPLLIHAKQNGADNKQLEELIVCGNEVSLLTIINKYEWTRPFEEGLPKDYPKERKDAFKKDLEKKYQAIKDHTRDSFNAAFAEFFSWAPNFRIFTEQLSDEVLKEIRFQQTRFLNEALREKIVELTGASHLVSIDIMNDNSHNYQLRSVRYIYRLIDIKTGKTLSVTTEKIDTKKKRG